ncbi:hypothetical protein [Bacillus sp. WP8]|nr:hypothetical protein [Bacillus sp. WP8]
MSLLKCMETSLQEILRSEMKKGRKEVVVRVGGSWEFMKRWWEKEKI